MSDLGPNEHTILDMLDFEADEPTDVIDVSTLTSYELSCLDADTRRQLIDLGQMHLAPVDRSPEGARLHSLFTACKIQMARHRHPSQGNL